jgi:hypothetical protein
MATQNNIMIPADPINNVTGGTPFLARIDIPVQYHHYVEVGISCTFIACTGAKQHELPESPSVMLPQGGAQISEDQPIPFCVRCYQRAPPFTLVWIFTEIHGYRQGSRRWEAAWQDVAS